MYIYRLLICIYIVDMYILLICIYINKVLIVYIHISDMYIVDISSNFKLTGSLIGRFALLPV